MDGIRIERTPIEDIVSQIKPLVRAVFLLIQAGDARGEHGEDAPEPCRRRRHGDIDVGEFMGADQEFAEPDATAVHRWVDRDQSVGGQVRPGGGMASSLRHNEG